MRSPLITINVVLTLKTKVFIEDRPCDNFSDYVDMLNAYTLSIVHAGLMTMAYTDSNSSSNSNNNDNGGSNKAPRNE